MPDRGEVEKPEEKISGLIPDEIGDREEVVKKTRDALSPRKTKPADLFHPSRRNNPEKTNPEPLEPKDTPDSA